MNALACIPFSFLRSKSICNTCEPETTYIFQKSALTNCIELVWSDETKLMSYQMLQTCLLTFPTMSKLYKRYTDKLVKDKYYSKKRKQKIKYHSFEHIIHCFIVNKQLILLYKVIGYKPSITKTIQIKQKNTSIFALDKRYNDIVYQNEHSLEVFGDYVLPSLYGCKKSDDCEPFIFKLVDRFRTEKLTL